MKIKPVYRIEMLAYHPEGTFRTVALPAGEMKIDRDRLGLLALIYEYGQSWRSGPHPLGNASPGDVIWIDAEAYLIEPMGFRQLDAGDLMIYRAMSGEDRRIMARRGYEEEETA